MSDNSTPDIPHHIAIIMDGNGRWAQERGQERLFGHLNGVESIRRILKPAQSKGVKFLTLYAFSTENWGRPTQEVEGLMELFCESIQKELPELNQNGVRIRFIGDLNSLAPKVQQAIFASQTQTLRNTAFTLVIALNYSARWEIVNATRKLCAEVRYGELSPQEINTDVFAKHLTTNDIPDPDLLIRTGGECRLSNFLLWQTAYSELYFTPTYWPDFDETEFVKALDAYATRERRFGLVTR